MPATTRQRKQSVFRRLIIPAAALSVLAYYGFHALNGELGLVGRARIERQEKLLQAELDGLVKERNSYIAKVTLLRPESLDPDMMDERARQSLNLVQGDELVILRRSARYANINQNPVE
ncbi:FtsB family cell division protein [Roseibium sp.]|uniref:FtsB family cell division protein n=1 Tax=Roseibium sp. TaxID=1936156 RepID=UPI003A97E8AE